jgi:phage tail-like protein
MRQETRPGWLVEQLPRPMAEDHFTRRLVGLFEEVAESYRSRITGFERYLDTGLAPPEFVRWLGGWVGLAVDPSLPEERQRSLVRAAGPLFPWRGTKFGLQGLLAALTRSEVTVEDGAGVFPEGGAPPATGHVTISIADAGGLNEQHLFDVARREIPAGASFELKVGRRTVQAAPDTPDEPEPPPDGPPTAPPVPKPPPRPRPPRPKPPGSDPGEGSA